MGIPDSSVVDLIEKIKSWVSWEKNDSNNMSRGFEMSSNMSLSKSAGRYNGKIYPSESPRQSPEPPSPCFSTGEGLDGHSPHAPSRHSDESFSDHPSPVSVRRSPSRSDDDEEENSTSRFFSTSTEYLHDTSDVDSVCFSTRHEFYSFTSVGSSPSDSPSRINISSNRVGRFVQQEQAVLKKPAIGISYPENIDKSPQPLDFDNNGLIWFPPPADDEENSFFTYDDEEDEIGDSGGTFSPNASLDGIFSAKENNLDHKKPLRGVVEGHFRALVSQLLQGQGIISTEENCGEEWLNIITELAWQAANFIKPDTSRGGSMDPCVYVKVKCVASGSPSESKLIKGVVCTKNIKHKRMTSQYKNTRILLLGGALEYQRVPNQLASFNTLLEQENDHLKMIVSKIEAHRPNVLLVEKSVSSFAQDQLFSKDISLVLNVKRPVLERIARCSGAIITPSTDHISTTRVGHCELFYLEKISEDHEPVNQFNRKPLKTLMFFEGCPRRLGCTVLLRGSSNEELKKLKTVVQYAVFAAYHLSLETSFLADEGATLPKMIEKSPRFTPEKMALDMDTTNGQEVDEHPLNDGPSDFNLELGLQESISELSEVNFDNFSISDEFRYRKTLSEACAENLALDVTPMVELIGQEEGQSSEVFSELAADDSVEASSSFYSANENIDSILVSFSSHCILNETVCERSRLLRVKFYGPSDKPLGRYLRDDLFDKSSRCGSCKESTEAHALCYTHQHGNLMINVRRMSSVNLPGEQDGKIWMWHRCMRCTYIEGVPPATRRVVMSDAAWGLSFGKFLELSFSNHASGNRIASCGHSLQRDCLRFYGFGSMIAFFQYSPINILSVRLPPSILEFFGHGEQSLMRKEASELLSKAEALYAEISAALQEIKNRSLSSMHEFSDASDLHRHVLELIDMLADEKKYYKDLLGNEAGVDILEINHSRHSLLIGSHVWDRRLYLLDSLLERSSSETGSNDIGALIGQKDSETNLENRTLDLDCEDNGHEYPKLQECPQPEPEFEENLQKAWANARQHSETSINSTSIERLPSEASILSDKIDSAWSGADLAPVIAQLLDSQNSDVSEASVVAQKVQKEKNLSIRRLLSPARVYSFDSAQRLQERLGKVISPSLHLSTLRSFHASGDYKYMIKDPVSNVQRTYSQVSPREAEKLNLTLSNASPSFISSISFLPQGARLMVSQNVQHDIAIAVYDDEPTSIISYAVSSKQYIDWVDDSKPNEPERGSSIASGLSTSQSFGSLDLDYMPYGNHGLEDASSPHLRISFEDESLAVFGKVKFSVTCYFAKQFDALRKRCCPSELDFIRSLSRCKRWSAQGGKSNVYFAKSLDERFIIKQVTKTELESFNEFAPEYFKYLTDILSSGSPTCLAKVLGIYQVAMKKGGKETKMDLMVMENLFFRRCISRVYDLKGSARSRYNADTTGANKVLLDMNLLETLRTNPIFLGSKSKRRLERGVWNDTSFLASVDVMDYSLLVGVDEERKELVLGIIDYMRQYTWDKQLETWVKASGILGGPKNASPTIISPTQYKKRFRKAMTTYFLTVPDQWSSS